MDASTACFPYGNSSKENQVMPPLAPCDLGLSNVHDIVHFFIHISFIHKSPDEGTTTYGHSPQGVAGGISGRHDRRKMQWRWGVQFVQPKKNILYIASIVCKSLLNIN